MIPAAPGSGYGLNAKSQNKAAALAFLNFMAEPDSIKDYSENSGLPSLFSTSQDGLAIGFDKVLAMIDDGRSALFMDQNWPNARVQQTMFSGIQDMFAGRATPEAVLARMDDAYTTA
jgi:raffinose/stachyose/melibiose transport system substrate-binding protein